LKIQPGHGIPREKSGKHPQDPRLKGPARRQRGVNLPWTGKARKKNPREMRRASQPEGGWRREFHRPEDQKPSFIWLRPVFLIVGGGMNVGLYLFSEPTMTRPKVSLGRCLYLSIPLVIGLVILIRSSALAQRIDDGWKNDAGGRRDFEGPTENILRARAGANGRLAVSRF